VPKCAAYLELKCLLSLIQTPNSPVEIMSEIVNFFSTSTSRHFLSLGSDRSWPFILAISLLSVSMALVSIASVPGAIGWFGIGLAELMLVIAVIDWRHFIIPDRLNAAAFVLGLAHAWFQNPEDIVVTLASALARGAVLAAAFWALRLSYDRLRGREGLGFGDVKLAGVAGVWLGWLMLPLAVELAAVSALAFYGLRQVFSREPMSATSRLPFGGFLAIAIWLTWILENASAS
jgi:leader peptidase (prepilin peptidase) / N-methyltransferase